MTQNVDILWIAIKGLLQGQEFPMQENEITFGRTHQNNIVMPEHPISRSHAKAWIEGTSIWICDLNSKNGTLVNSQKLPPNQKTRLAHKDRIQMGTTVFELHILEKTQADTSTDSFEKEPSIQTFSKKESPKTKPKAFKLPAGMNQKRLIMYGAVIVLFLFILISSATKSTKKQDPAVLESSREQIRIPEQFSFEEGQKIPTLEEIDPLIAQAESAMRFEDYHKAIRIFERVLKVRPEDQKVLAYYQTAKTNLYRKIQKHQDIARIEFEKLNYEGAKTQWMRILQLTDGFDPELHQQTLEQIESIELKNEQ